MCITPLLVVALGVSAIQESVVVLENDYVRIDRDAAPCAAASSTCRHRVIVAFGELELRIGDRERMLARGDIAVFEPEESYEAPTRGSFVEVTIKPNHPAPETSPETIAPEKNVLLYDGEEFFIFEERLAVGDTRPRHSHNQRVVIQLNETRLQQWPDGRPEVVRDIPAGRIGFNQPVIHVVKNVGDLPLRGIVIEFKRPD